MPAMNVTMTMLMPFQTSTSTIEYRARVGFPNQSGCGSPKKPSAVLMSPTDGCFLEF